MAEPDGRRGGRPPRRPLRAAGWSPAEAAMLALLAGIVLLFAALPLVRLAAEAVLPGGRFDIAPLQRALAAEATWRAARHSLETSIAGMAGSVLIGGTAAVVLALTDIRARLALVFCFMLPMMVPPQITALAWLQMLGPASPLLGAAGLAPPPGSPNPLYSPTGIMALLSVQHAPLAFLVLRAALRQVPRELIEAARLAGARPAAIAWQIVLPLLLPALLAAAVLCFVSALGNFGIPAMLGIPQSYFTLPTLIYRRLASFGPAVLSDVAVLAALVALLALVLVAVQALLVGRGPVRLTSRPGAALFLPLGRWRPVVEAAFWLFIAIVFVLPVTALVAASLAPAYGVRLTAETVTLANYAEVLLRQAATGRAFANSFALAGLAAVVLAAIALPLGYLAVWRRRRLARAIAVVAELPYALPGVVLAIAVILVFLRPLPLLGVSLYGTLGIIFVAYLGRFLALALRPVLAGFQQVDPRLEEAAQVCGAPLHRRFADIVAPLLAPVAAAGAILVFLTAFNELTVSALLWSSGTETLGVIVYNLDDSGFAGLASAVAVVVVLAVLLLMLALQAMAPRLPDGVVPWAEARRGRPAHSSATSVPRSTVQPTVSPAA